MCVMCTVGCAAVLFMFVLFDLRNTRKLTFVTFFFKFCRRMLHGSGFMRFEVFQDGEDSACGRVICTAV